MAFPWMRPKLETHKNQYYDNKKYKITANQ